MVTRHRFLAIKDMDWTQDGSIHHKFHYYSLVLFISGRFLFLRSIERRAELQIGSWLQVITSRLTIETNSIECDLRDGQFNWWWPFQRLIELP